MSIRVVPPDVKLVGKCLYVERVAPKGESPYWYEVCGRPVGYRMEPDDDGNRRKTWDPFCREHREVEDADL